MCDGNIELKKKTDDQRCSSVYANLQRIPLACYN